MLVLLTCSSDLKTPKNSTVPRGKQEGNTFRERQGEHREDIYT
jgi:hypothetical protein